MFTAQYITSRVRDQLNDTASAHYKWTDADLLGYLNEGRREMAIIRPDIYAEIVNITLTVNTPWQECTGSRLLSVLCNVTANNVYGKGVQLCEREDLEMMTPSWRTETGTSVANYMHDARMPRRFLVYPIPSEANKLEVMQSTVLTDVGAGDELTFERDYAVALINFTCYRAMTRDSEHAGYLERAAAHYNQFRTLLVDGYSSQVGTDPNTNDKGGDSSGN